MIKELPFIDLAELKGDEKIPICNEEGRIIGFLPLKSLQLDLEIK